MGRGLMASLYPTSPLYPTQAQTLAPGVGQLAGRLARKFPRWSPAFVLVNPTDKTICSAPGLPAFVGALANERPELVLGLALGRISQTVVVDLDSNVDFHMERFPVTVTASSPRDGRHLFYGPDERGRLPSTRWLRDVAPRANEDHVWTIREKGYEVLSDGAYVPLPPAPGRRWLVGGQRAPFPDALDFAAYGSALSA